MNAQAALGTFLNGALARRRERYLGFINKAKTQAKFLDTIYHILERDFDRSKEVSALPPGTAPIPGYMFAPPDEFGSPLADLREICNNSVDESFLAVSRDGQFGVHGPEAYIKDRAIYRIASQPDKQRR